MKGFVVWTEWDMQNCFLHIELREKGGAYGGMAGYNPEEGIFYMLFLVASLTVMTVLFRWWNAPTRIEQRSTVVAVSANLTPEAATLYPEASSHDDSGPDK